jgi:hypothetical protein
MYSASQLQELAARVEGGDRQATDELRGVLAGRLHHIVRRALSAWDGQSVLDRRILAEAERATGSPEPPRPERLEGLVQEVTRRLCTRLLRDPARARTMTAPWLDTVAA